MDSIQRPVKNPMYVLSQVRSRAIVPRIVLLFVLGAVFYIGILLNVALLELGSELESLVELSSLIILFILILVGIFVAVKKSRRQYLFFSNRITFGKKVITYTSIVTLVQMKRNVVDRLFKTYSIALSKDFKLKHISNEINMQGYITKILTYSRRR